jgi:lipopolysaccharide transport system ATP-binding protein
LSVAIKIENLSKQYRLGLVSTRTLSHDINRWYQMNIRRKEDPYLKIGEVNDTSLKDNSNYVWALRDINLEVQKGEVLGIIGKNGAGKSTLLKILSKVTVPTIGTIKAKGRIASLLEVGTGFHPEMTGRENIFMNGAILGMTKAEIQNKFDEIVDFAGVEKFIDTPVKRYSSGMMVRLGFAVAAHLEPEILVVDEVLAVGDAEFQKKAIGKMQDISRGQGKTVLFVSHNLKSIQKLCTTAFVLKNGFIEFEGNVNMAILSYKGCHHFNQKKIWYSNEKEMKPAKEFHVLKFALLDNSKILNHNVKDSDDIYVLIEFESNKIVKNLTMGISVFDEMDNYVYRSLHTDIDSEIYRKQKVGINQLQAKLETKCLKAGTYRVVLDISYHNEKWVINPFEEVDRILIFTKEYNQMLSPLHATNAFINPIMSWNFNTKLVDI